MFNEESEPSVNSLVIDQAKEFAPVGNGSLSDHNVMIACFNWVVAGKELAKSNKRIVTARGYAKIKVEMVNENLQTILLDEERSTQDLC